jgi:hypothetical protein
MVRGLIFVAVSRLIDLATLLANKNLALNSIIGAAFGGMIEPVYVEYVD